jgi:hypothetical protein
LGVGKDGDPFWYQANPDSTADNRKVRSITQDKSRWKHPYDDRHDSILRFAFAHCLPLLRVIFAPQRPCNHCLVVPLRLAPAATTHESITRHSLPGELRSPLVQSVRLDFPALACVETLEQPPIISLSSIPPQPLRNRLSRCRHLASTSVSASVSEGDLLRVSPYVAYSRDPRAHCRPRLERRPVGQVFSMHSQSPP